MHTGTLLCIRYYSQSRASVRPCARLDELPEAFFLSLLSPSLFRPRHPKDTGLLEDVKDQLTWFSSSLIS